MKYAYNMHLYHENRFKTAVKDMQYSPKNKCRPPTQTTLHHRDRLLSM